MYAKNGKDEQNLSDKLCILIDLALSTHYQRFMSNKKSQKSNKFIDPSSAMFNDNRDLILDQVDLVNYVTAFLTDETLDSLEAKEYLINTQPNTYGFTDMVRARYYTEKEKEEYEKTLNSHIIDHTESTIKDFRERLTQKIDPHRENFSYDIEIHKPGEELYKYLLEMKLYQWGESCHTKLRMYSRYFVDKIAVKSRDLMSQMLIIESDSKHDSNNNNGKKGGKGGKRNKRNKRKKNKDKINEADSSQVSTLNHDLCDCPSTSGQI